MTDEIVFFKSRYYFERADPLNDIKVDYDFNRNPIQWRHLSRVAGKLFRRPIELVRLEAYRTSKGAHLRGWTLAALGHYSILRVQKLLGDDPIRQQFNRRRVRRGEKNWNVLWNEKWRNGICVSREVYDEELTQRFREVLRWNSC